MPRREQIRYLGRTGSYVSDPSRALRDGVELELEPVDAEWQERLASRADLDRGVARELTRATLAAQPLAVRIARCRAQAKATGVDVYAPLRIARLALENGRSAEHVGKRLAVAERKLWPHLDGS